MKVPNFAEIANVYAAAIDFRNYPELSQVDAGRFISFDMRAADGCEYIARTCRGFSELEPILLQGKEQYDRDIQSKKVICNPSRVMLLRLIGGDATSVIHSQLAAVDNYDLLRYIVDNGPWPNDHWDVVCPELAEVAKRLHDLHNVSIEGVKKVAEKLNIEYHSRLGTENGVMSGTVTLAVNGELFIVDVHCLKGSDRVTNRWVTLPQQGYDTTVHSLIRWFDDVAAAAIMITIYPDNGRPQTVTVTLNA